MSLNFCFKHETPNKRAVILFHGLTGTPYEMKKYGAHLFENGYDVFGECLPGHGDDRENIYTVKYQEWIDFVSKRFEEVSAEYEDVFVSGLCLGAVLSLALGEKYPDKLKGIISLSTTFRLDGWSLPWYAFLMHIAMKTIYKFYYTYPECEPYGVKNPRTRAAVKKAFEKTEVGMDNYPMSAFQELLMLSKYVIKNLKKITTPILIIHSKEDDLTSTKSANLVYEKISSKDKELIILDNSYHMVVYDNDKKFVFEKSVEFMNAHCASVEVKQ